MALCNIAVGTPSRDLVWRIQTPALPPPGLPGSNGPGACGARWMMRGLSQVRLACLTSPGGILPGKAKATSQLTQPDVEPWLAAAKPEAIKRKGFRALLLYGASGWSRPHFWCPISTRKLSAARPLRSISSVWSACNIGRLV